MAPDLDALLHAAVQGVGGVERPGQVTMAKAVEAAIEADEHLLVQAGTGTGKSLAYLIPAVAHAVATGKPAVVATATLALQAQIVDRDMPRLADGRGAAARPPSDLRAGQGAAQLPVPAQAGRRLPRRGGRPVLGRPGRRRRRRARLGAEVVRLREWADETDVRRPRRARPRRQRARLAAGVGLRPRVPGRQVPDGQRVLRRARPRRGQGRRHRRHQPLASWPSTPSRAARCCPSTTCSSSTRRTSWSTG